MKRRFTLIPACLFLVLLLQLRLVAQTASPLPYCNGNYTSGQCNQPGPSNTTGNSVNDFIDDFSTTGASTNISNLNSGCNGNPNNYIFYCQHYLVTTPGQTISCTLQSGIIYSQGFGIWVDWNQDNVFASTEYVCGTAGVPTAATPTTITFVIPPGTPNGVYRMRVRCAYSTPGPSLSPCGTFGFGETEDYNLFVGPGPTVLGAPNVTTTVNSPVCVGQTISFSVTTPYSYTLSYLWAGPSNFTSTLQNPTIPNATTTASGIYTLVATNGLCPVTKTISVVVVPYPVYATVANPYVICQGGNFIAGLVTSLSPAVYSCTWSSTAPGVIYNPVPTLGNPPTFNTNVVPALLPQNVPTATFVYSVTVSPTLNPACAVTQTLGVTIINPLTPTINPTSVPLCDIFNPVQLTGSPAGGSWSGNPAVTAAGMFTPALAAIGTSTVKYSVTVGACVVSNTGTVSVSRFHTAALSSTLNSCVLDPQTHLMSIVLDTTTGYWSGFHVNNNIFTPTGLATGNYTLTHYTFSTPVASACPASTTMVVPVFNPATPVIGPIVPLCDINPTVALTASPPGGVWSGNPGVSAAGIRTPSLNFIGTNTVSYTAGQGTCVASSSKTFNTSHFNPPTLTNNQMALCVSSNTVNLMNLVVNTNGYWTGINVNNSNVFLPAGLPTNTYNLIYTSQSTPIASLCPATSTLAVSILNPPIPSIAAAGPYCSKGSVVQLSVTPATGYWVSTPYLSSGGSFSPALCTIGNNQVQYIIGTATCNAQQSATISIEAFVSATLVGQIGDQCTTNQAVPLAPIVAHTTGSWTGSGINGSFFNPPAAGAGQFTLTYHTASSPSGLCPDQSTLAVQVFSLAPPVVNQAGPFCNNSGPVQLIVSPVGGLFASGTPGAVSQSGIFNPASAALGSNLISYSISLGPCRAETRTNISVEAFVPADLGPMKTIYCQNEQPFNLNSFAQYQGGIWTGPGVVGNNMFSPGLANIGANNILIYETHSATMLCKDTSAVRVEIKQVPVVTAEGSQYIGCAPMEVFLHTPSTNSGLGSWYITDGAQYSGLSADHIFKNPGTYTVVFTYQEDDAQGCKAQVTVPQAFVVNTSPKADFTFPDNLTIADPEVDITNLSTVLKQNRYLWTVQGQTDSLQDINPVVKFSKPGNYQITLLATSVSGCTDVVTKNIEIKNDFNVHIPNSFTPNFDGRNDIFIPVFTPYGLDTRSFEMEIFDRWGQRLYYSRDATKGWDGIIQGEVVKEDTYIYRIRYKDLDGRAYTNTGHLSLLKN